jgi:hypothetical protein
MNEHLQECFLRQPCGAGTPKRGFCSRQQTFRIHCERECICDELHACERRVKDAAVQQLEGYLQHHVDDGWMPRRKAHAIIAAVKGGNSQIVTMPSLPSTPSREISHD